MTGEHVLEFRQQVGKTLLYPGGKKINAAARLAGRGGNCALKHSGHVTSDEVRCIFICNVLKIRECTLPISRVLIDAIDSIIYGTLGHGDRLVYRGLVRHSEAAAKAERKHGYHNS